MKQCDCVSCLECKYQVDGVSQREELHVGEDEPGKLVEHDEVQAVARDPQRRHGRQEHVVDPEVQLGGAVSGLAAGLVEAVVSHGVRFLLTARS